MKVTASISVLLALSVVIGFIYMADRHTADHTKVDIPKEPIEPEKSASPRLDETQRLMEIKENKQANKNNKKISKCLINGKTVYSDIECENEITAKAVEIHETNGIGTKTVQAAPARKLERQEPEKQVATIGNIQRVNCTETKARIEMLDSLARQPLQGHQQDSIREERRKLTALPC